MKKNVNLLEGPIFSSLTKLALPIMATSLVQMAYNMTDMIWIGRVSSNAVAAVGAAGMYMWLASGFATLAKMGGQVKVAHELGAKNETAASNYAKNALQLGILLGVLYGLIMILFASPLIGFFRLNSRDVIKDAETYLIIVGGGILFTFINQIMTGILTAMGDSQTPFTATAVGLVVNIILDPILIFGIGPFPKMGVMGAAIATVLAQLIVTTMFMLAAKKENPLLQNIKLFTKPDKEYIKIITKIGFPSAVQSIIFTSISMIIARLIAGWGDAAVAVQKVGSQIESISWMTAEGFAAAVNSFVAQNHGSGNTKRVKKGYGAAMTVVAIWGIFCTCLLLFFPQLIFQIFIPDKELLPLGIDYLRILGLSQLLMCIEITTSGALCGLGKTIPPSIIGIVLTSARIPLAIILSTTALGLNGIWWSITISSNLKGIILFTWFLFFFLLQKKKQQS